ncbi:hypothetical protein E0198_002275 [Clavispora lusitaniae]|nr:hypothetical protein E0198_002275 [Clavispora lusitaniae]
MRGKSACIDIASNCSQILSVFPIFLGTMSARESSDTLLELQDVNESSKSSAQWEDSRMAVDVVFKIWNNQEKFPDRPVRYIFDRNVTVIEAGKLAFEAYVDNYRGKIYASIEGEETVLVVGNNSEKLSTFIQNGEQLILSDVPDYNRRRETREITLYNRRREARETKSFVLTVVGIFVLGAAIFVVIQHFS